MSRVVRMFSVIGIVATVLGLSLLFPGWLALLPSAAAPAPSASGEPVGVQTKDEAEPATISVSGQGRVMVTPDLARVALGVEIRDPSLATAQGQAAARMQTVLDGLKQAGVEDKDIQTIQYLVQPLTRHDEQTRQTVSDGFLVRHLVRVTFREIGGLGSRLDQVTQGGTTTIQSVQFDVSDPAAALRQAREQAVADARARADHLASLTGVAVGRPLSISEGGGPVPPQPLRAAPAADGGVPTQIEPGQAEIQMTVHIRYAIQ